MGYLGTKPQIATTLADNIVTADKIVSGAVTDAKIAAMAATKLTGTVPDANAPSGSVIQVVNGITTTGTSTTSTSFVDSTLTASITPSSTTSKILVIVSHNWYLGRNGVNLTYGDAYFKLVKNSTDLATNRYAINFGDTNWNDYFHHNTFNYLDSPATTSATTYKIQFRSGANNFNTQMPFEGAATITLLEIAA